LINVSEVNSSSFFDFGLFPDQNPMNEQFFIRQFEQLSHNVSDISRQYYDFAKKSFDDFVDSGIMRTIRAAQATAKNWFHPNSIVMLETIEELQAAQPMMQRYMMANPTIRTLYHRQLCNGFSDSYKDMYPGVIGETHQDYRKVMTGAIQDYTTPDGEESWHAMQYLDDMDDGDRELDPMERLTMRKVWEIMDMHIANKVDITDPEGGELGN
jgi:hypothetical protein